MIGTPLELIRKGLPSDCIFPPFWLDIIWVSNSAELSIFHVDISPVFYELSLFLIVSMVEEDEFLGIKTKIFTKSEPWLILKSPIVLLDEFCFLNCKWRRLVDSLLIGLLFAAGISKTKNGHLIDSHIVFFINKTFHFINIKMHLPSDFFHKAKSL